MKTIPMETFLVTALLAVFVGSGVLACVLLTGCATPRSDTRRHTEHVSLTYRNCATESVRDHVATGAEVTVLSVATDLGIKLAKSLVKQEAAKYEATASDTTTAQLDKLIIPTFPETHLKMGQGGFFVFLRTIRNPAPAGVGLASFDEDARRQYAGQIQTLLKHQLGDVPLDILKNILGKGSMIEDGEEEATLAFCAVGLIRQRASGLSFEIQLLGYIYPALKAKNTRFRVPFARWHKTDSVLLIQVEGPQASDAGGGRLFVAGAAFPLEWDRAKALARESVTWVEGAPEGNYILSRSKPISVPPLPDITITATLTESSDLKATLEKAADLMQKLGAD